VFAWGLVLSYDTLNVTASRDPGTGKHTWWLKPLGDMAGSVGSHRAREGGETC
jgi:hypothetical protein